MNPYRQPAPRPDAPRARSFRVVRGVCGNSAGELLSVAAMIVLPVAMSGHLSGVAAVVVLGACMAPAAAIAAWAVVKAARAARR